MTYLGVDFGASTGVCILHGNSAHADTLALPKGPQNESTRYYSFRLEMANYLVGGSGIRVVFEEPSFHRGGAAGKQNAGYRALLMEVCEYYGTPFASVPVATLKAFARERTGIPSTGKLIAAAHAHAQSEGHALGEIDDNAADAYWLAVYGRDALSW